MKKYFSFLLILTIAFTLIGCKPQSGGGGGGHEGEITLSYASWGNAELDELLIAEFEATHPNVKIYRDTSITGTGNSFTANLVTAAQGGVLPDVFITDNVITVIENGLVRDVSEQWNKDEDAKLVYSNIANTAVYNGKRYAIPSFQYIKGMLVNKTLLTDSIGIECPSYNWTFEEFKKLCEDHAKKSTTSYNGSQVVVQGVNGFAPNGGEGTLGFEQVMPGQDSDTLLYDAWNGTSFEYSNPLWIKYRAETDYFFDNGLVENLTAEEKEAIYGAPDAYLFQEGVVMFGIEGSWNVSNVTKNMALNGFEVDFYPFPAGKEHQIPVILDYICVSSQTAYPDLAYEFAKFMSYGKEGWKARLKATEQLDLVIDGYPVADYPEVWSAIKSSIDPETYGGLLANLDLISNGIPDSDKWMPGYSAFWVWVGDNAEDQGFWDMPVDQLAVVWQEKINSLVDETKKNLGL